jgi:hypothetical protein
MEYSVVQQQIIDSYGINFRKTYNYPYSRYETQKLTCLKYINEAKSRLEKR